MPVTSEKQALTRVSAAGNRFHLWDGFAATPPADLAREAVRLCLEDPADGLLLILPTFDADCRMVLFNADGSRAETCGNGLRCAGKLMFEAGRLAGTRLRVKTDVGISTVEVLTDGERDTICRARAELGLPRELKLLDLVATRGLCATFVDLGNPHCVLLGERELLARLPELGPRLERHPVFPHRANIEFACSDPERENAFTVRVWERGVGETAACGSGACATALAAVEAGLAKWPVTIAMPGGELRVDLRAGALWLEGPVEGS